MLGMARGPVPHGASEPAGATVPGVADGRTTEEGAMVSRAATIAATPRAPALAPRAEAVRDRPGALWFLMRETPGPRNVSQCRSSLVNGRKSTEGCPPRPVQPRPGGSFHPLDAG